MLRLVLDKKPLSDRPFILNVCSTNGGKLGRSFFFFFSMVINDSYKNLQYSEKLIKLLRLTQFKYACVTKYEKCLLFFLRKIQIQLCPIFSVSA